MGGGPLIAARVQHIQQRFIYEIVRAQRQHTTATGSEWLVRVGQFVKKVHPL